MSATLTLIGMYNYDDSLFSNMTLPDGIQTQMTISAILSRSGEFEVLYPDLDFMKQMIGFVSHKWNRTFTKWYNALQIEYDPLYNYDRYEEWKDSGTDTGTINRTGSDTGTVGNSGSSTSTEESSGSGQTDTFVNAYDNNTLVEDGQSKSTQSANSSGTDISNNTETRNLSSSDDEERNLATSGEHTGHMYGNIGVTTSQQMLEAELDIAEWNLYEHIADVFVRELCIPVYG